MNDTLKAAYLAMRAQHFGDGSKPRDARSWAMDDSAAPRLTWEMPTDDDCEICPPRYDCAEAPLLGRATWEVDEHRTVVVDLYHDSTADASWLGEFHKVYFPGAVSRQRGRYFTAAMRGSLAERRDEFHKLGYARGVAHEMALASLYDDLDARERYDRGDMPVVFSHTRLFVDGVMTNEETLGGTFLSYLCDREINSALMPYILDILR